MSMLAHPPAGRHFDAHGRQMGTTLIAWADQQARGG